MYAYVWMDVLGFSTLCVQTVKTYIEHVNKYCMMFKIEERDRMKESESAKEGRSQEKGVEIV